RDVRVGRQVADLGAGARVERAQQRQRLFGLLQVTAEFGGDAFDADPGQPVDVVDGDAPRQRAPGRVVGQVVELQHQAFAQVACTHADRIQALDLVQHEQHFVRGALDLGQQRLGDRIERFAQVAVVVDRVDQHQADAAVA